MQCPKCERNTIVVNSRRRSGPAVRRSRRCEHCGLHWITNETIIAVGGGVSGQKCIPVAQPLTGEQRDWLMREIQILLAKMEEG